MLKKIFAVAILSAAALCAFAQKSVKAAITDIEEDPSNGLEMTRCLFNEYYLAELTTHSKVTVNDSATVQKKINSLKIPRGVKLSAQNVKALCKALNAKALCLVSMTRNTKDKGVNVLIRVVSDEGKLLGSSSGLMKGIGEAGKLSAVLAAKTAPFVRSADKAIALAKKEVKGSAVEPLPQKAPEKGAKK
ncbi:MAG: hypothetical protein J6331_02695 [Lentisphaeria bacterium]|nr:hypothetical protein [Lentisphaeria bacterium]